jgi:hypothetical protein
MGHYTTSRPSDDLIMQAAESVHGTTTSYGLQVEVTGWNPDASDDWLVCLTVTYTDLSSGQSYPGTYLVTASQLGQ